MDCLAILGLTLSEAASCIGGIFSSVGAEIGKLTIGQVFQSAVAVGIAPAFFGSVALPFKLIASIWSKLVRHHPYVLSDRAGALKNFFILWYGISGLIGFVVGVNFDNNLIALPGLWLMICAVFFIVTPRGAWAEDRYQGEEA